MHAGEALRQTVRGLLPMSFYQRLALSYGGAVSARKIGRVEYRRLAQVSRGRLVDPPAAFRVPEIPHAVLVRPGTTDAEVFEGNLLRRSYDAVDPGVEVRFIIDAGANAGYSCLYFLNKHPRCRVVALEPDSGNYELAERNLAAYGARIMLLKAGIWPTTAYLRVIVGERADGIRVEEVPAGAAYDVAGIDPIAVLAKAGAERINIFKIDVEGAEEQLFGDRCDAWIERTDCIVTEIHTRGCEEAV